MVIFKARLKLKQSPYEVLQIMIVLLLDKNYINSLCENSIHQDLEEFNSFQLKIN